MQQQDASFWLGPVKTSRACLLIHGFSGTPKELRTLANAIAAQGFRTYTVPLAGHTGNPDDMLRYGRKDWLASAEEGLAQLARYPHVFVVGFSMGGVLALQLALHHPKRIAAVAALSTPTRFTGSWQYRLVPYLRYVMKWYYPLEHSNFSDPQVQASIREQAQVQNPAATIDFSDTATLNALKKRIRIPIPAIAELMKLTRVNRRKLHKLQTPLIIIQSKNDHTITPDNADDLFALTSAANPKELHWLERSDHLIVVGPEKEQVCAHITAFFNRITLAMGQASQSGSAPQPLQDESSSHH